MQVKIMILVNFLISTGLNDRHTSNITNIYANNTCIIGIIIIILIIVSMLHLEAKSDTWWKSRV